MTGTDLIFQTSTNKGYKLNCKWSLHWRSYLEPTFLFFIVQTGLFINNEFVTGAKTIDTINPANGEVITSVQAGKLF